MTRSSRALVAPARAGAALVLSGCDFDVYKLPLPGGPDVGDDPMTVTVEFADVLDLVPQSTVKVNDVTVGKVTDIDLEGYSAMVTLELRSDIELPDNAVAESARPACWARSSSSLRAPEDGAAPTPLQRRRHHPARAHRPQPRGRGGARRAQPAAQRRRRRPAQDHRPASSTSRSRAARTPPRSVLRQIERASRASWTTTRATSSTRSSRSTGSRSRSSDQRATIDAALEELPSALESIEQQRADLVRMLQALNRLGAVGVRVIRRRRTSTIDNLRQLDPVLTELANSGDDFVNAFHVFLTYPFVDEVVGRDPQVARNLHMGDYTNLSIQLDVDWTSDAGADAADRPADRARPDRDRCGDVARCLPERRHRQPGLPEVLATPQALLQLKEECAKPKNEDKGICKQLNLVPGLPRAVARRGSGGGGLPLPTPSIPGLPRAGCGPTTG